MKLLLTYCLSECVLLIFLLLLDERKDTSPSVIEAMITTAYEKTKKSEKSTDDSSDKKENFVQGQIVTDTVQEASVDGQSEHVESKNTSEDFVQVFLYVFLLLFRTMSSAMKSFVKKFAVSTLNV